MEGKECDKKDLFRETKFRFVGYANEVGEAFRAVIPGRLVRASYGLAFTYVVADTVHKGFRTMVEDGSPRNVLASSGDALLWQTLASIIIPGFTINRICKYSHKRLASFKKIPPYAARWMTVGIGLASIPIIVLPIDYAVTVFMNHTYRKWMKRNAVQLAEVKDDDS